MTGPFECSFEFGNIVADSHDDAGLQDHLGVPVDINFTSCSEVVDKILQPDVMKDVANLVPDLLAELPVLLYQGERLLEDAKMVCTPRNPTLKTMQRSSQCPRMQIHSMC